MKKLYIDLGNSTNKTLIDNKRILECSNIEEVAESTFGSYKINNKYYIFGENAKSRKQTNKIIEEKRNLLSKILYTNLEDNSKVDIVTLLPLSLYIDKINRQEYSALLQGQHTVTNMHGFSKTILVNNVDVYCEGYSALITDPRLLQQPTFLVEIGGTDLTIMYVHKTPDTNKYITIPNGMNIMFSQLSKVFTSKFKETYSESDTKLTFYKYNELDEDTRLTITTFVDDYLQKNVLNNLYDLGYKKNIHNLCFVGGGSEDLSRWISIGEVLKDSIWKNIEGAKLLDIRKNGVR